LAFASFAQRMTRILSLILDVTQQANGLT
jgi:hypothetical protein